MDPAPCPGLVWGRPLACKSTICTIDMELWITRCVVQRGALARNGLFFVKTPKSMFILILCMIDM